MSRPPVSGHTRVAAVIGDPVRHSLSPALHNAAFEATGLDWVYVALPVAAGDAHRALDAMRALDIGGLSVTMPHKHDVARLVDRLSPHADALDAVNCVRRDGDELVGENTDGDGLVAAVRDELAVDLAGARVVVVGAGGAARAAIAALAGQGARIGVVNRTESAARTAAALAGAAGAVVDAAACADADLVVQATPLGMSPSDPLPIDPDLLSPGQRLVDLIYHPARTPLLAAAHERGVHVANGLGMLLHQAGLAFTHWTGVPAPIEAMRIAVAGR